MSCSTSVVGFDKVMESDLTTKGSSNNQGELDRKSQSLDGVLTHLIFWD
jgi:hypothetical protein